MPDRSHTERTERILQQGQALVRAIEALETIEATGALERAAARLLLYAYRRRLRGIVELVPDWLAEEILSASQAIGKDRAAVWLTED